MYVTALLIALTALAGTLPAQTPTDWAIDGARSEARFTVTKLGFEDVTGVFGESEGEIHYDPGRPEASRVWWRVRVASVLTDAANRDATLRDPEYFDARRHPFLQFESRSVKRLDDGRLEVAGDLTMRGVTRPLVIAVRHVTNAVHPHFETHFTVNRYDFGIVGGRVLGRVIGRTVRVRLVAALVARSTSARPGGETLKTSTVESFKTEASNAAHLCWTSASVTPSSGQLTRGGQYFRSTNWQYAAALSSRARNWWSSIARRRLWSVQRVNVTH